MADLAEMNAALTTKIVGADAQGNEQGFVGVDANTRRLLVDAIISGAAVNVQLGNITLADGPQLDAFGRLRSSEPYIVFDSIMRADKLPQIWAESVVGTGSSSTHDQNISSVRMTVGTASGCKVVRQTRRSFVYMAGKSQLILITGNPGGIKTNVRQRWGYFDDQNGLFFELSNGTAKIVLRSYATGSVLEEVVPQSQWNVDKLDGTGPSGVTIAWDKQNIFIIDMEWLGTGRCRYGIVYDGKIIYCHYFNNANYRSTVYMSTGKLPLRWEIENTGTTASNTTMIQTCSSVDSEGGGLTDGINHAASNGIALRAFANVRYPILAIRPDVTKPGMTIKPLNLDFICSTPDDVYYEVIYNASVTGGAWVANDTGGAQVNKTATGVSLVSGQSVIMQAGYIKNGAGFASVKIDENILWLGRDLANTADTITLCMTCVSGSATGGAAIRYRELI